MPFYDLNVTPASLSVLSPRETAQLCLHINKVILTFFRDVHLVFHPLEQAQITEFLGSARRFFDLILAAPSHHNPAPKIEIVNILVYMQYGLPNDYQFTMTPDVTSMINIGPVILTKIITTLHQSVITRLRIDYKSSQDNSYLHNWAARSNCMLQMMNRMCSQCSNERNLQRHRHSTIIGIRIRTEVTYGQ
jgi:hypothetical protein